MTDDQPARAGESTDESSYVVARVRGERIEVPASVLDDLGGVAAADEMTAEAWLERNLGPSILYGGLVQLVDEFGDAEAVPSATRVARWRAELAETREAAEEVWDSPTLGYAEQIRAAADRLETLLETLETSTTALEECRRRYSSDHELVEELAANVRRQVDALRRVANALTD
ncbi:hypothetical protein SAMN04487948_12569 [Halogranum amylolyticum]|uniref:Uncharacterized protein n=1 Tax=Halogranum amylolyticum TaxID=660520 RepID=A0A1H8W924_9EURY|nr:hypothetical protein [Halogranum amylolyticum]SEP24176.1 hypothetical protein SAMN04487948_12569 [Halogranum amylolyticum]